MQAGAWSANALRLTMVMPVLKPNPAPHIHAESATQLVVQVVLSRMQAVLSQGAQLMQRRVRAAPSTPYSCGPHKSAPAAAKPVVS